MFNMISKKTEEEYSKNINSLNSETQKDLIVLF